MMRESSLPLCSCLKSNMQTPEKCVKSIQSEQKRHQNHVIELGFSHIVLIFPWLTLIK